MICADFLSGASLESGEVKSPTAACPHESRLAAMHQAPDAKTNSRGLPSARGSGSI